jgi:hypothetical protein
MQCPLCGTRKARRACPALGRTICAVCCGTKRLSEIACTPDCAYLASAREHPAAVIRRQQERDVAQLLPTISHLTERQYQLFFLFQNVICRHKPDGFTRLVDADIADAAAALAGTLETASRGVIYEHGTHSVVAHKLLGEMKAMLASLREQGARVFDGEAAITLRAIEQGAREVGKSVPGEDSVYLSLVGRLLQQAPGDPRAQEGGATAPAERSPLILP